jgi:hypothetical protein
MQASTVAQHPPQGGPTGAPPSSAPAPPSTANALSGSKRRRVQFNIYRTSNLKRHKATGGYLIPPKTASNTQSSKSSASSIASSSAGAANSTSSEKIRMPNFRVSRIAKIQQIQQQQKAAIQQLQQHHHQGPRRRSSSAVQSSSGARSKGARPSHKSDHSAADSASGAAAVPTVGGSGVTAQLNAHKIRLLAGQKSKALKKYEDVMFTESEINAFIGAKLSQDAIISLVTLNKFL